MHVRTYEFLSSIEAEISRDADRPPDVKFVALFTAIEPRIRPFDMKMSV